MKNLTGLRFNRWFVISKDYSRSRSSWLCRCDCGTEKLVFTTGLLSGSSQSCGCLNREKIVKAIRTHGQSYSLEYKIWAAMKRRCFSESDRRYKDYGGRGITVCSEWIDSFENFIGDLGTKPGPGYSIDRIDNNGNYEPSNCRWATAKEQSLNRRPTTGRRFITFNGETKSLTDWAKTLGIKKCNLWGLLKSRTLEEVINFLATKKASML